MSKKYLTDISEIRNAIYIENFHPIEIMSARSIWDSALWDRDPIHLLIVCADPTSIKQQKGLHIAQSLLPGIPFDEPTYSGKFPITATAMGKKVDGRGVHQKDYKHLKPLDEVLRTPVEYQAILLEHCPLAILTPHNVDILLDEAGGLVFHFIKAVIRLPLHGYLIMTHPLPLKDEFAWPTNWIHSLLKYFQIRNTIYQNRFNSSTNRTHTTSWGLWQKTADPTDQEVFEQVPLHFVNKHPSKEARRRAITAYLAAKKRVKYRPGGVGAHEAEKEFNSMMGLINHAHRA